MSPHPDDAAAPSGLTHLNASGEARMVDVSGKAVTSRSATAAGRVLLSPDAAEPRAAPPAAEGAATAAPEEAAA